ncbi:TetR/AcrR family transcriptional regulator [Corynebacterium camporealensis]
MRAFSIDQELSPTATTVADATIRIIVSRGLDAVSVRAVAKEANLAPGTVQYHAKDKDTLLAHAFIRSIQRQTARSEAVQPRDTLFATSVARLAELLPIGNVRSEDACVWVTFGSASATRDWLAELYDEALAQFRTTLETALARADGTGPIDETHSTHSAHSPAQRARLITALVNGLTIDNLRAPESSADDLLADLEAGLRSVLGP